MTTNYPDGTWDGDPLAPWNRQDPPQQCDECDEWARPPVPCVDAFGNEWGWCQEQGCYTTPDTCECPYRP